MAVVCWYDNEINLHATFPFKWLQAAAEKTLKLFMEWLFLLRPVDAPSLQLILGQWLSYLLLVFCDTFCKHRTSTGYGSWLLLGLWRRPVFWCQRALLIGFSLTHRLCTSPTICCCVLRLIIIRLEACCLLRAVPLSYSVNTFLHLQCIMYYK